MAEFKLPGLLGAIANDVKAELQELSDAFCRIAPPFAGSLCPVKTAELTAAANKGAATPATVDARSEGNIATLLPEVQPYARSLVLKAAAAGITIKIIGGSRTYAEQDALYAKGRTAPGKVVTKAQAGHSNHNFGIAFDIGVFSGRKYLPESPDYKKVGPIGESVGLSWGGNWKSFEDLPHYELRPTWADKLSESQMLDELRKRKAGDLSVFGV